MHPENTQIDADYNTQLLNGNAELCLSGNIRLIPEATVVRGMLHSHFPAVEICHRPVTSYLLWVDKHAPQQIAPHFPFCFTFR